MSSHHDAHDDAHGPAQPHPLLPTITDDASDTPMWLPVAGIVIFVVLALYVGIHAAMTSTATTQDIAIEAPAAE
jgi:hypothetical protein